jgi:hypothetical protein
MGWMQGFGEGVFRLLAARLMPASVRIVEQVTQLAREGRNEEACDLIGRDAGLTSEVYADRGRLAERLSERLRREDPNLAAIFVVTLAGALGLVGRRDQALAVFEVYFGVETADYLKPSRLAERLHGKLDSLVPELALVLYIGLVGVLGMAERHADGLAVLQADLGLERNAEEPQVVEALRRRLEGTPPDAAATYALSLAVVYGVTGRDEEAIWVLQAYFDLEAGDYGNPDRLGRKIRARLEPLQPDSAAGLVLFLAMTLESTGQRQAVGSIMEGYLELTPEIYDTPDRLAARLESRLAPLMPVTAANYVLALSTALSFHGRAADALALLRAYGGEDLGTLRSRLAGWPGELAATYVRVMAATLGEVGDPQAAILLLEGYAGLRPEDYRSQGALAARLATALDRWTENASAAYVFELLSGLQARGETAKAAMLVETYVEAFGRVADREGSDHALLPQLVPIYDAWLESFGGDPERWPLEVCRDLIRYLRKNLDSQGALLKDRVDFIGYTSSLRRRIVDMGHLWAQRESDPGQARRIWLEAQLWDAELTQRLLIERFLLEPIVPVQKGDPPARQWPWSARPERPDSTSHLPDTALVHRSTGSVGEGTAAALPPQILTGEPTRLQKDRPYLFQKAREIVQQGLDEARLAQAIGAGSVLLRATFRSEGHLLWTALRSDGSRIQVLAQGAGHLTDLEELRWAAARHDFQMVLARLSEQMKRFQGVRARILQSVRQALDELLFELGPGARQEDLLGRLDWISQRFLSPGREYQKHLLRFLVPVCSPLQAVPGPERFPTWAKTAAGHLRELQSCLAKRAPAKLQPELDRITGEYIDKVREVWKLDELANTLSPEVDLLVQLDDALHTVPVAHLPVGGRPLFQQVRSVRNSLTLLMTSLQLETEQEVNQEEGEKEMERLLSVSHFTPGEGAETGAVWLHHGLAVLAADRLHVYAAAETPVSSVGLLRSALEDLRRFRVLAICGHGDLFQSGIALAPGDEEDQGRVRLWDGGGCDLSGVDWLWMVSCSIGRLGQNGDRDVEGFCVRLALHRARSVAAFRWPVHSLEAVSQVNESVRLYLEALRSGESADSRCLRARALNDARKSFFGDGTKPPLYSQVGLNTAAGCELFGLG